MVPEVCRSDFPGLEWIEGLHLIAISGWNSRKPEHNRSTFIWRPLTTNASMKYRDLREFCDGLEAKGELRRVVEPVSTVLEMTALSDRVLRSEGPALWFERPVDSQGRHKMPALTNLFGTPRRVAMGMGASEVGELRDVGRVLASLKEPEPPKGLKDTGRLLHMIKSLWDMKPATVRHAACQQVQIDGI